MFGLENNQEHKNKIKELLKNECDYFELHSNEDQGLLAYCYRSTQNSINPIYLSIGHKISWSTCLWVIKQCVTKYRIPEPIRIAVSS